MASFLIFSLSLSLSLSHTLSLQDGERLSSSVADDLQVWFSSLTIDDVAMTTPPIPSLLVSDHDNREEKEGVAITTPIPTETPPPLADEGTILVQQNAEPPPLSTVMNDNESTPQEMTTVDEYKGQISVSEESGILNNGYYRGRDGGREGVGEREREGTMNGEESGVCRESSSSGQPEREEEAEEEREGEDKETKVS